MTQPQTQTHFALPSWLRVKNETPPVQAALLAVPLVAAGAAVLGVWLWRQRGRPAGASWVDRLAAGLDLEPESHQVAAFIRQTLIGLDKASIRRLLGAPSAAGDAGVVVDHPRPQSQKHADHWYYRLDRLPAAPGQPRGSAIVVAFDDRNRARDARFILPPAR